MNGIAGLLHLLDRVNNQEERISILRDYFSSARDDEKKWALYFLSGRRLNKCTTSAQLKRWAAEISGLPLWLLDESCRAVGDFAEACALVVPPGGSRSRRTISDWMHSISALAGLNEPEKQKRVTGAWQELPVAERSFFNKVLLGTIRSPIPQHLLYRALAKSTGANPTAIALSMKSNQHVDDMPFDQIIGSAKQSGETFRPYLFLQTHPLVNPVESLGNPADWQAEWTWDGLRAQLIKREGELLIWSVNEELFTEELPELINLRDAVPDGTVLDGQLLAFKDGLPRPSSVLVGRLSKIGISAKVLKEAPIRFVACDIMENAGVDLRDRPLAIRRRTLEQLLNSLELDAVHLSRAVEFGSWNDLAQQRGWVKEHRAKGIRLRFLGSPYHCDNETANWWEWKPEPQTIKAVLISAEKGGEERPDLYSRYTFAVWQNGTLVPCAKIWSGLTEEEMIEIDTWVRTHTREKFGPVCTVVPELVFEIGFEGIEYSRRRKSGVMLSLPRIMRWHRRAAINLAGTVDQLHALVTTMTGESVFPKQ